MRRYIYFLAWYLLLFYWYARRPHSNGTAIIIYEHNNILLIRHCYGHRELWGLPGGHKKNNEEFKDSAVRELYEETGLKVNIKKLGEVNVIEDFRYSKEMIFFGSYNNSEIKIQKSEIIEYKWFPINEIPENMFKSTKEAIALYLGLNQ